MDKITIPIIVLVITTISILVIIITIIVIGIVIHIIQWFHAARGLSPLHVAVQENLPTVWAWVEECKLTAPMCITRAFE